MFGAIAGGIASALAGGAMSKLFGGGFLTASKRSEERFSRNAETDLVCRLLLEKKNCRSTFQASGFPARPTSSAVTVSGASAGGSGAGPTPSTATSANGVRLPRAKARTSRSAAEATRSGPLMQTSNSTGPACVPPSAACARSEEHTSELQSRGHLVCRLLLEKKTR